jgi:hypothetical protein
MRNPEGIVLTRILENERASARVGEFAVRGLQERNELEA